MGNIGAYANTVGAEFGHAETTPARSRSSLRVIRRMAAPFDAEDDELLFGVAPISEIDLPADGGAQAGSRPPLLTVMNSDGQVDPGDSAAAALARAERARQVLRAMLRQADRAAS